MRIERVMDATTVEGGAKLFDEPPLADATTRFLESPTHHLLFAFDDTNNPVGMVSGVETTHPDKGTEMFLYELSVAPGARRQGVATTLVLALVTLSRELGCYGMWVGVDSDNEAALATYRRAGGHGDPPTVIMAWDFSDAS